MADQSSLAKCLHTACTKMVGNKYQLCVEHRQKLCAVKGCKGTFEYRGQKNKYCSAHRSKANNKPKSLGMYD